MKKLLVATTIASLVLTAPAARANEWGGLAAGLAGGLIAGAIASSMPPHMVYVPVQRHYRAPVRVVVVHDLRSFTRLLLRFRSRFPFQSRFRLRLRRRRTTTT
jgi:hypothetical protein